tara:strand:+ start:245 stop:613 length:369 start_codon:yes stop_codon:yes gene_type:complete
MNTNDKKKYIFDNIFLIEDHTKIYNFIFYYDIKHSINNNGCFVNISKLSDDIIDKLYDLILNTIENNLDYNYKDKQDILKSLNDSKTIIKNTIKKETYDIELNIFSNSEKTLIRKSKNYKFE